MKRLVVIVSVVSFVLATVGAETVQAKPPVAETDYQVILDRIERLTRNGASEVAIDRMLRREFRWIRQAEDVVVDALAAPTGSDVDLFRPTIYRNLPAQRYEVIARWQWRDCGSARCWYTNYPLNDGPIGGPDGFAINTSRAVTNLATSFGAYTEDGGGRSFSNPEVFESDGVGFSEQDAQRTTDDDYSWDHGTLVFAFRLAGGCVPGERFVFASKLGHTWADAALSGIGISTSGISMTFSGSAKRWTVVSPNPLYWTPC